MIAFICFVLAVLTSPFKSKSRLDAENAVLRHQLIVLRRRGRARAQPTNRPPVPRPDVSTRAGGTMGPEPASRKSYD
jgi:hypothetical protein